MDTVVIDGQCLADNETSQMYCIPLHTPRAMAMCNVEIARVRSNTPYRRIAQPKVHSRNEVVELNLEDKSSQECDHILRKIFVRDEAYGADANSILEPIFRRNKD